MNGDNDGFIKPERTKIGVEKDFIAVKGEHSLLLGKKLVSKLVIEFLKHGSFVSKHSDNID